ncbi:MAG TPA: hypothetical protein VIT92_10520, partial [Burkholderiaceae bacterium]
MNSAASDALLLACDSEIYCWDAATGRMQAASAKALAQAQYDAAALPALPAATLLHPLPHPQPGVQHAVLTRKDGSTHSLQLRCIQAQDGATLVA